MAVKGGRVDFLAPHVLRSQLLRPGFVRLTLRLGIARRMPAWARLQFTNGGVSSRDLDRVLSRVTSLESWVDEWESLAREHEQWARDALTLGYRPGNNAGIGWAAANCVLWNCSASVIRCWNPPGATNWSFGSWASFEGDGVWKCSNDFMKPDSLFEAQLSDRLGAKAAAVLKRRAIPTETNGAKSIDELLAADNPLIELKDRSRAKAHTDGGYCF